jgi:hypothetical protein
MRADDDGFVNPKMVMRLLGSPQDEIRVLIAKRFVINFESGVVVIKHWLIHNLIRSDLYKETLYLDEKNSLGVKDNGAYTELRDGVIPLKKIEAPEWLKIRRGEKRTANGTQTVPRLGQVRVGQDRIGHTIVAQAPLKTTEELWKEMLAPFINSLAPGMVIDFENHWRAKNPGGKKERWQMEKVFDMSRRLATWKRNEDKFAHRDTARQQLKKVDEMPTQRQPAESRTDSGFSGIGGLLKKKI